MIVRGFGIPKTCFCFLTLLFTLSSLLAQDIPSIGVGLYKPEKCDASYRIYFSDDMETAHLINANGRYLHTWSYPAGTPWRFVEMQEDGSIRVLLDKKKMLLLDWNSQPMKKRLKRAPRSFRKQARKLVWTMPSGNSLITDWKQGRMMEMTNRGELVWEYRNPDLDQFGRRMQTSKAVPVSTEMADNLLAGMGIQPDFKPKEQKQRKRIVNPEIQYKKLNRESIAEIEVGYLDDAHRYLVNYLQEYPEDQEALFALSLVYTRRRDFKRAVATMQKAIDNGLPLARYRTGLTDLFDPLFKNPEFDYFLQDQPQEAKLLHGPMLANTGPTYAGIWVRTAGPATVEVVLFDTTGSNELARSNSFKTTAERDFAAHIDVNKLSPATTYNYEVRVNGYVESTGHRLTTYPRRWRRGKYKIGFAGGAGYTPEYERMWDTLATHSMQAFLLMGDNVYIDHPERPATQQYCYYRRQTRPEYRRFTSQTPVYAIWDDHDFTYNDDRGGPEVGRPYWKKRVWQLYQNQWFNPYYGGGESQPGCYFDFSMGDIDFFMLDCRYYREDPKNKGASMLGDVQKQWLFEKIKESDATFKIIASSVPWAKNTKPGSLDTWDGHPEEREEIFSYLEENKIDGVILLAADRHRSDAWKIERPNGYSFFEFMSSKLTNMHTHKVMEGSLFGYNQTCSFGLLEFDTTRPDPQVTYRIINIENEEIHRLTVYKSQLTHKKEEK